MALELEPELPEIISLVGRYLRADAAVANLVGDRVGTRLSGTFPAVRLDASGGTAVLKGRLDQQRLEVHAYASDEFAAITLARKARAAIDSAGNYTEPGVAVITATDTVPPRNQTDPSRTPTVYDYAFTATITARPDP